MKQLLFIFVVSLHLLGCLTVESCSPDYFWRDYWGQIPEDAIEGGKTPGGTPFYVAQAYFRGNELLPATVFPNKAEAIASAYAKEIKTRFHVKILCSSNKNSFKWIPIESKYLNTLTGTHIVVGGSEVGETLYIGRVFHQGSVVLGKIFQHSRGNRGLWIPSNGGEANYLSYEILTYNCDAPDQEPIICPR